MKPTLETLFNIVGYSFKFRHAPPKDAERIEIFDNFTPAIAYLGKRKERTGETFAEHLYLYELGNSTFLELVKVKNVPAHS